MSKRAFTLIEVLTVIAIIGILASITGYVYNSAMKRSRDTTRKTDLDTIKNGLEQYYLDNRVYVPLIKNNQGPLTTKYQLERYYTDGTNVPVNLGLVPRYISTIPTDPTYKSGRNNNETRDYQYLPKVEKDTDAGKVTSYFLSAYVERQISWSTTAPVYKDGVGNRIGIYTNSIAATSKLGFCYRWDDIANTYPAGLLNPGYEEGQANCTSTYYLKGGR